MLADGEVEETQAVPELKLILDVLRVAGPEAMMIVGVSFLYDILAVL